VSRSRPSVSVGPGIVASGLIDTLRLARQVQAGPKGRSLTALLEYYQLTGSVSQLAPDSQPRRALWDAVGCALLLEALVTRLPGGE
jgi:DNA polymerase-3 subunit epsilon